MLPARLPASAATAATIATPAATAAAKPATAAAAATTAAEATAPTATTTAGRRTCLVDGETTPVEFGLVEPLNRGASSFLGRHLDEPEAARPSRGLIAHHAN